MQSMFSNYVANEILDRFLLCADPREVPVEYMTVDAKDLMKYLARETDQLLAIKEGRPVSVSLIILRCKLYH